MPRKDDGGLLSLADLLAIVDHELGNIATVILALATRLDQRWDCLAENERRDLARRVASEADALTTLLKNLRVLRAGGPFADGVSSEDLVDPSPVLTRLADDLRLATPAHQLVVDIEGSLPPMPLDVPRLGQEVRNVVGNAAKFSAAGSAIEVRVRRSGPWLELTVDDAGPGIPPEDRERVFHKFVQLDPTRPGTGLGLFISRAIVDALGGEMSIGESPAGGCRVCVRLPIEGAR
jgi:signal transduction histidine kinase